MPDTQSPLPPSIIDELVLAALEEDGAYNDVTTRALVNADQWGRGVFVAKDAGIICGLPVAAAAMTSLDETISFDTFVNDGDRVTAGTEIAEVEGHLAPILSCERVALNFLQRMSGIATLTAEFVLALSGTQARILDTRKTTPGLRLLERYAVRCGGGTNHRFNLSDGMLIKDNHIAAAKQRGAAELGDIVAGARAAAPHTLRIEIEASTLEDVKEAIEGGADVILLDNMSVEEMRLAVDTIAGRAIVEASGGITIENVAAVARTGVNLISSGSLTHSAPSLDISLEVGSV